MSGPKPNDFFSSFLAEADADPAKAAEGAQSEAAGIERTILGFLLSQSGPVSVREMLGVMNIPPSLAVEALKRLADAKLVDVKRVENDDSVVLSDLGRRVAA